MGFFVSPRSDLGEGFCLRALSRFVYTFTIVKNNRLIGSIVLASLLSVSSFDSGALITSAFSYVGAGDGFRLDWWNSTWEQQTMIAPDSTVTIPVESQPGYIDIATTKAGIYRGELFLIEGGARTFIASNEDELSLSDGDYEFDIYKLPIFQVRGGRVNDFALFESIAYAGQVYDDENYVGTFRFSVGAPLVTCCSNVAFFPGLQASRLYSAGGAKRWEPAGASDTRALAMTTDGASADTTIYAGETIDTFKVFGINTIDLYKGFSQTMETLVADGSIKEWKAFPYDWRKNVLDIVTGGIVYEDRVINLKEEIESLAATSDTGKVTLIAHSNGGLVVKALMRKLEAEGKGVLVDKIILVAVPQLGTPDAVKAILHGMSIGFGMVLDAQSARTLAANMPGVYGLLPSNRYFDVISDPVISFDPSVDAVNNFVDRYGGEVTTKAELDDFLRGADGRVQPSVLNLNAPSVANASLLAQAGVLHDGIDTWTSPEGVELVQIAGWGINTIKGIRYVGKFPCSRLITVGDCSPYVDPEPMMTREGDKTVVYPSAIASNAQSLFFNIRSFNQIERKNLDHKNILEAFPVKLFLESLILNTNYTDQYISELKPEPDNTEEMIHIAMHSPASIDIYDSDGRHTGIVPGTGDIQRYEESIPNSYYFELGESKYAGIPNDVGTDIKIRGTGAGTFTFVVEEREGETVKSTTTFTDIPVTPELQATYDPHATTPTLAVDSDGNGTVDFSVSPGENIDPTVFLQMFKKTIVSLKLPKIMERQLLQKVDKLIAIIKKDSKKKEKLILAIQHYKRELEGRKWKKTRKLSLEQKAVLIVMMNSLLDNIK